MLTRPHLADDRIVACLRDGYGLNVSTVIFLPINVDPDCAVFRVVATDDTAFFLKLRRRYFNPLAAEIPAFLHAQGIQGVMAPLATAGGALWTRSQGFTWLLYPFFKGKTALRVGLPRTQWITLGRCMSAIHEAVLPAELAGRIPREDFAPRRRSLVRTLHRQATETVYTDPTAAKLAGWWTSRRDEIETILERADRLAGVLRSRAPDLVLCHADLHANNVLVGAGEALAVVDWDEPILAPKERDLMFVGGGVGGAWNQPEEERWFYEGYGGAVEDGFVDDPAIAYYRYERIVEDFAGYGERILGMRGNAEDREEALRRLMNAFLPGNVVDMAHRAYLAAA